VRLALRLRIGNMMRKGGIETGERGVGVVAGRGKRRSSEVIWRMNANKRIL
jgi:hypothetical protein